MATSKATTLTVRILTLGKKIIHTTSAIFSHAFSLVGGISVPVIFSIAMAITTISSNPTPSEIPDEWPHRGAWQTYSLDTQGDNYCELAMYLVPNHGSLHLEYAWIPELGASWSVTVSVRHRGVISNIGNISIIKDGAVLFEAWGLLDDVNFRRGHKYDILRLDGDDFEPNEFLKALTEFNVEIDTPIVHFPVPHSGLPEALDDFRACKNAITPRL
jgi:hypothetical protein